MIQKTTTIQKLAAQPHHFTRHEFIIPDDTRAKVENGIRELTSDFTLSDVRDRGKMVKLSPDEINIFKTKGGLLEGEVNVEEHFGHLYRQARPDDFKNRPDDCEQVTRYIPNFPESIAELISSEMTEVVNALEEYTDDPFAYILITNSPIGFPFGQKNDTQYQDCFPNKELNDRHPIAEAFQYGLLKASGHTVDCPFPGRAYAPVTPQLKMIGDDKNSLLEELSSTQPFNMHIDGANYNHYSSLVCLAFGTGDNLSETLMAHTHAVFDQLDELDIQLGYFNNGMGRRDVLGLEIFEHGPGTYSTCMNVVKSPVIYKNYDSVLRPRINLIDGRTRIRADKLSEFSLTNKEVQESLRSLKQASENRENTISITIDSGQVTCFSGELLHARSAFSVDKRNPRYAVRVRGTSKKQCLLLEDLKKLNSPSGDLAYIPGV